MNDSNIPLCVEFEGALTPVNTAHEKLLALLKSSPQDLLKLLRALLQGKTAFWRRVTTLGSIDLPSLPLQRELIEWLRGQRRDGRAVVLLADDDIQIAKAFAEHVELFDEVAATSAGSGPTIRRKLDALVARYGPRGFDFVGGNANCGPIFAAARRVVVVGDESRAKRVGRAAEVTRVFPATKASVRAWLRAVRLHQWVKNALIFVPALLAHTVLAPGMLGRGLLAFIAFGLCASSVYVLNDLFDLAADRNHPRKRHRPFAAGVLSVRSGLVAVAILLSAAAGVAIEVNMRFAAVLAGYYALTWSYSLRLKRIALLDVMVLAALYTIRIIAGAAATYTSLSFWLLAFSVFMFLSLGFVKRYAELDGALRAAKSGSNGRGYGTDDLPLIMSLGTAAGYCSVVVMALYLNSADSQALYHHHKPLWFICPLMLFWISRVWTVTARGNMHDDPVVFALRDRTSLLILGLLGLIVALSI